jgi:hypothetical protein
MPPNRSYVEALGRSAGLDDRHRVRGIGRATGQRKVPGDSVTFADVRLLVSCRRVGRLRSVDGMAIGGGSVFALAAHRKASIEALDEIVVDGYEVDTR